LRREFARKLAHRGHHVAVILALLTLLALSFLFTNGGSQPRQEGTAAPVIIAADGLTYTLDSEAETVADALAAAGVTIGPKDSILRNGVPVDPSSPLRPPSALASSISIHTLGKTVASPIVLSLRRAVMFTIYADGLSVAAQSSATTVADALVEAGIELGPDVLVIPDPESPLSAGLQVYVYRTDKVTLFLAKQEQSVYTLADTVAALLRQEGVELGEEDRVEPALDTPIRSGMTIRVSIVETITEVVERTIYRQEVYQDDPNLEIGSYVVIDPGSDGYIRRTYDVTYENGEEVGYELVSEEVISATAKVIARGTKLVPGSFLLPDGTVITYNWALDVYSTWYNAASSGGDGITATGAVLDKGIVAVDPSVIPLGTRMYVPGYGYAVAADTGGGIIGHMIDLGYPGSTIGTCCTGWITIYILD
jgi:uncharacterized protein YabE (DUF348 family)/3D (Asp-Asp-Asp) domain-containing protein